MATRQAESVLRHVRAVFSRQCARQQSDRELLRHFAQRRDEQAFAELVRRHGPMVLAVCCRVLHQPQDAEDAFQAAFLILARKAGARGWHESIANWLYLVARRLALRLRAETCRRRDRETRPAADLPVDVLETVSGRELCAALDEELSQLPERYRAGIVLCYLEGQTRDEAARQLGWTPRTLKRRLERGRALLRARLERRGFELPAALTGVLVAEGVSRATVPAALAQSVARAATAGTATSASVLALAETFLSGALLPRLRIVVIVLLAAIASAFGYRLAAVGEPVQEDDKAAAAKPVADSWQPKAEGRKPRTDAYGDPLPPDAIARLGTVRLRHGGPVWSLAFAPDGKTLLSGSNDKTARLWDVATGKELQRFADGLTWVKSVAFGPEGKTVFTGRYGGWRLWDAATGKELAFDKEKYHEGYCIAASADGKILAAGRGKVIEVLDTTKEQILRRLDGASEAIEGLALSRDGKFAAAAGKDSLLQLWDATTGKLLHTLKGHAGEATSVAFSPDGKTLASGSYDKMIRLWDVATGKELRQCKGHEHWVEAVSFSPDGKLLVSAGRDWFIRYWDPETAKELRHVKGHRGPIAALAFSPDGKTVASGGLDNMIRLWDAATGEERPVAKGMMGRIGSVAFLPDNKTVVSGSDEGIRVWEAATGKEIRRLTGQEPRYSYYVAILPDGRLAASGNYEDHKVRIWEIATGKEVGKLEFPEGVFIGGLAFSPDGKALASTCYEGIIQLWDVAAGKELRRMRETQKAASSAVFAPDGKTLATASGDASGDHTIRFWDAATGKELRRLELHPWSASDIAFSPDGKVLAAVGGQPGVPNPTSDVRLWDVATGRELPPLRDLFERGMALAFSPDGRTLATNHCQLATPVPHWSIRLWEIATGKERALLKGHASAVLSLRFAPNGRLLVSGSGDTTGLVWDLTGRQTRKPGGLSQEEVDARWADLAADDAGKAWRAIWDLALAPESAVPHLSKHLRAVSPPDAGKIAKWIKDLDADDFATRRAAGRELEGLGELAAPALRKALEGTTSPELRRQATRLLEKLTGLSGDRLRQVRAVEALETMNTVEGRQLLQKLADGALEARLTREAKAALERLAPK